MNRRELIYGAGAGLVAGTTIGARAMTGRSSKLDKQRQGIQAHQESLKLSDYEPISELRVKETHVPRARFPVIDTHTHLSFSAKVVNGVQLSATRKYLDTPEDLLPIMDQRNILAMVNLTGGYGSGLTDSVSKFQRAYPGRFYMFTEPSYEYFLEPNYPKLQAMAIEGAVRNGAKGLKILKTLGLYLRENITSGKLVKVDDPRFDLMWDACGQLNIPVSMHIADPLAFFKPIDRFNERYEELHEYPSWSFYGRDFPSYQELLQARNRVIARHPKTRFVALHMGNSAINLADLSTDLDRYSNMTVDIAARISELGRQPRTARKFFDKYQDRIVFGTDATPDTASKQQAYIDQLYQHYFRFLETDDEYFNYAPEKIPPQGRWEIYGINLPESILRKIYNQNAARELGITL